MIAGMDVFRRIYSIVGMQWVQLTRLWLPFNELHWLKAPSPAFIQVRTEAKTPTLRPGPRNPESSSATNSQHQRNTPGRQYWLIVKYVQLQAAFCGFGILGASFGHDCRRLSSQRPSLDIDQLSVKL